MVSEKFVWFQVNGAGALVESEEKAFEFGGEVAHVNVGMDMSNSADYSYGFVSEEKAKSHLAYLNKKYSVTGDFVLLKVCKAVVDNNE